jgi:DNA repair exonuclease SbcCD ATPase subunit
MSDSDRLREKSVQIAMLNQKLESVQAQLSGATRRNTQLSEKVKELEAQLQEKDYEIQSIRSELERSQSALDSLGQEMQGVRSAQKETMAMKKPVRTEDPSAAALEKAVIKIARLQSDIKTLSEVGTSVILKQEGSLDKLSETIKTVGDIQHRIFNMVMEQRAVKTDELASMMLTEVSEIREAVDSLQAMGEVELKDGATIIPAKKYREIKIPVEEWKNMSPSEIFDSLESVVEKAEGKDPIVEALESAVDIIEQKLSRGGAMIFQMRRTASDWKKQEGNVEELRYTIKDWKSRAEALS